MGNLLLVFLSKGRSLVILFFLIAESSLLFADNGPQGESAGAEQRRFQEESDRQRRARSFRRKISDLPAEFAPETKIQEAPSEGPFFRIEKVKIVGNQNIPAEKLEPLFQDILQQEVSLQELQEVASKIKQYYREEGYIAAYVYVPPQKITNGIVEFRVLEGKLGKLKIVGNRWFSEKVLRERLHAAPDQAVRFEKLRSDLARLNRHRDIKTRAVLKEGVENETTDIEILVKDKFPWHLGADVNNRGTRNTGRSRWGVSASHTNLFGKLGEIGGRFQIGKRVWGAGGNLEIPVFSKDTRLGFSYSRSSVEVGGDFAALNIEGDATTYGLYLSQPVVYQKYVEASLGLGFDWKSVENRIFDQISGKDEFRVLRPEVNLSFNDPWGRTQTTHEFDFGFSSFLGASDKIDERATRVDSGGQFFIYRASLLRFHRLPGDWVFSFRGTAQLTPDRLAPSEELQLGGAFSVRGYPEAEYLGDYGAHLSTELLVPSFFVPESWHIPFWREPLRKQVQGVFFFDFGGAGVHDAFLGETKHRILAGTGAGVRVRLADHLFARFEWAAPVGSAPRDGSKMGFYFSISSEFF